MNRHLFLCLLILVFGNTVSSQSGIQPLATIPFRSVEHLIFVKAQINGSSPLWFILDSGASGCVIEKQFAESLGLKTEGSEQRQGAGAGKINVTFTKEIAFSLSGFQMKVDKVMVIDFGDLSRKLGHECAGLLGYEFFNSYVISIDYDSRVLRFYEPSTFKYSGEGEIVQMQIKKKLPYVRMRLTAPGVETQETELLVDSGSADSVDSDVIAKSNGNKYEAIGGIGLGEPFKITLGKFDAVQVGKIILKDVHGASGASLIGGNFLHRFRTTFDYSRLRIIFEPNQHFMDETLLNLSGIDLESVPEKNAFVVSGLLQGFAAEKAGFLEGDIIIAIDRQPANEFTWEQVVRLLHQDGQEYWFTVKRKEEIRDIRLVIPKRKRV